MSSTSNAQDLLVNVFRPTYRWDSNTGFVPSLTLSNVSQIITGSVTTGRLAVSDSNLNTYIGSNAGDSATGTASNVALGYSAMAGALNSSNNVAAGMFSLDGLSNSDCNVALGARTDITGRGRRNVLIGPSVTMGDGSGNILIGVDISAGSVTNRFQLGTLLYGDLSSGYLGVNTTAPTQAFDVSGVTVFRGKVGFQNDTPVYSLDVNGSIGVSERFIGSNGSVSVPIYSFGDPNASNSGLFVPTDASYGLGAIGVSVRGQADLVIASNKTYIFNGLDVCGTITSSGGSASFLSGAGSVSEPAYSFSSDTGLGFYRTTDASGTAIGIAVGGQRRLVVGSNKLTMLGNLDVCGTFSAVSGGGGSGTVASNGSAAAPSFTFSNDSTTGLYLQSAGNLSVATGGVRRMTILNTGDVSAGQLVVSGYLRDTTNGTWALDISGGNISNSGTTLAGTFETINALTTNRIGGVTLESSNITNTGTTESGRFTTRATSSTIPGFNFVDATGTGLYPAQDVSYGTGALGVSVNGSPRIVVMSNKTFIYGNLDVCGTLSAAAGISGGGGGTVATNGSSNAPSFTFSNDSTTGMYLPGSNVIGLSTGGGVRMTLTAGTIAYYGGFDGVDAGASNSIGGVTLSSGEITTASTTSNSIGGVTLNNGTLSNASSSSNSIGGVTLQDGVVTASNAERVYYVTTNTTLYPPSGYSNAHVTLVGGGGGGAGATGLRSGGGGGSGYTVQHLTSVFASLQITIGTGGTGGTSEVAGGNGTTTTVLCDSDYWMTAPGGEGGKVASGSTSGAGGVGTYGGGGGGNGNSSTPGAGGIGKWIDGSVGGSTGGSGGAGSNGGSGGGGGGGGGPEGGDGGYVIAFGPGMEVGGDGYSGLRGGGGGGGGGGAGGGFSIGNGGAGGDGYCIVRFLQ